jgi:hypothetical protein
MRPHHVDPLGTPSTLRRPGYPEQLGPGYDPGAWDAPGVVAFSDVDAVPAGTGQGGGPMLRPWWRHGCVPEVDDDQLAALRRLRAAFGPIEVVEVISHDPPAAPDESMQGRGWPTGAHDPRGAQASPRAAHSGAE